MKTIDEIINDKFISCPGDTTKNNAKRLAKDCVEFAQRWIPVEEELPIAFELGGWDGKRSEFVIAKSKHGNWHKARTYQGKLDGVEFCDFVKENDEVISGITHWRPIELK